MSTTGFFINLEASSGNSSPAAPYDYNSISDYSTLGTLIADITDNSGMATGYSLELIEAFGDSVFTSSAATVDAPDRPLLVVKSWWETASNESAEIKLSGLPVGATMTLGLGGNNSNDRDTDFTVNGVTGTYIDGTSTDITAMTEFTVVVPANGEVSILVEKALIDGSLKGAIDSLSATVTTGGVVDDPKLVFTKALGTESGASSSGTDVPYWVLDPATDSIVLSGLMSWASGVVPTAIESASLTASTEYIINIIDGTNIAAIKLTAV